MEWLTPLLERSEAAFARADDQTDAIAAADAERSNVRTLLAWAAANGRDELALRLAGSRHFWAMRSSAVEGRRWLDDLLARPVEYSAPVLVQAKSVLAGLALWVNDLPLAHEQWSQALALFVKLGNSRKAAIVENNLEDVVAGITVSQVVDVPR